LAPSTLSVPRPAIASSRWTIKREIGIGTLLQIAGMLLSAVWFADRFSWKQEQMLDEIRASRSATQRLEEKVDRIEKYLSSKDSRYWQTVAELQKTEQGEK